MKKRLTVFLSASLLALAVLAVPAMAAQGGAPAAHGVDGPTFGKAVSGLAMSDPAALAAHVGGK
jgi:hypothetical protein